LIYHNGLRIGRHTSKAGSLEGTALKAQEVGSNCLQIFSSSPRQWRASKPDPADIKLLKAAREKYDLMPLVIHDSYLINLASRESAIRTSSIAAFRGEIERAIAIGAEYLVMHPGNHKGQTIEEGLCAVIEGIEEAAHGLRSKHLQILLENTVGSGAQLGSRFEELRALRELTEQRVDFQIGFCLDTCHCFASGRYNVSTVDGLKHTVNEMQTVLGLEHVKVIHCNDSKGGLASRLDRHANIGAGLIGVDGFRRIINQPKLKSKAFIMETPVDNPGDDKKDLDLLKSLVRSGKS
jgi:deoxyribonuclease-4